MFKKECVVFNLLEVNDTSQRMGVSKRANVWCLVLGVFFVIQVADASYHGYGVNNLNYQCSDEQFVPAEESDNVPLATKLRAKYDYIIVGAGTSGSVLAARLTEDPNVTVLVVEYGPDDRDRSELVIPLNGVNAWGNLDWAYHTVHDREYKGLQHGIGVIRAGRVLGGSSSIKSMEYCRGSPRDFDRWSNYTDDETWNYKHVLSYFKKAEGADKDLGESPYHSTDGPLGVSREVPVPLVDVLVKSAEEAGIPRNGDYNGESMLGVSYMQRTTKDGERVSTSTAYLRPALSRPNLDVAVDTEVTRVVVNNGRAIGIELRQTLRHENLLMHTIEAKKEVILSAGAIGSPKLLMLSGIGPRKHLEDVGINVIADLPVGENLQDHPKYHMNIKINESIGIRGSDVQSHETFMEYAENKTGPLISSYGHDAVIFTSLNETNASDNWPAGQIYLMTLPFTTPIMKSVHFAPKSLKELQDRDNHMDGLTFLGILSHPKSRGHVQLRSCSHLDLPLITPNYYNNESDVNKQVKLLELMFGMLNTQALKAVGAEQTETNSYHPCESLLFNSPDFWRCEIKHRPLSTNNPAGTCKMGPVGDKTAVVDSQLRVHGIAGLRVVDASIMPWITSCNIAASTIMIAEKAADMIREKLPLPPTVL